MAKEKGKPLTRDDVLRLIKENGGTAKGLDLSGKTFVEDINLRRLDLRGIILKKATLWGAHFKRAWLDGANLEGSDLWDAHLEGADLYRAEFSPDTKLENVDWGNYVLGNEEIGDFEAAEDTYRRLKIWYTNAGMYDIASKFYFREMTVRRKALEWWPNPFPRAWSKFLSVLCGYGEMWHRAIISAVVVIFGLAGAYYFVGSFDSSSFSDTLYYSAASFTALGYGRWAPQPIGWAKAMGAAEAFIGVFMMALFLVTFVRKMTR